jgi:hypothetical protein
MLLVALTTILTLSPIIAQPHFSRTDSLARNYADNSCFPNIQFDSTLKISGNARGYNMTVPVLSGKLDGILVAEIQVLHRS